MQNQCEARFKQSNVEKENNSTVVNMLIFLIISSLIISGCALVWENNQRTAAWYLNKPDLPEWGTFENVEVFVLNLLTTICLNSTFIPISLIVALEVVKIIQSYFISKDYEMIGIQGNGSY